jgi:hypothetical protein
MVPARIVKSSTRRNEAVRQLGRLGNPISQFIKQEVISARAEQEISCENCLKLGVSSDFKVCGACKRNINRCIYYCSKFVALNLFPKTFAD